MSNTEQTTNVISFGGDIGHGYVKTSMAVFPSKVKVGKNLTLAGKQKRDTYAVVYRGQDYVVGDGAIFTGDDRYFTTEYKLALLTAIALNNPKLNIIEVKVAIGVPIERHHRVAKKVADYFRGMQEWITLEGKEVLVKIKDMVVFIEGAYPVLTEEEGRVITIDMGAGTINVTEFLDGAVDNYATYSDSMYSLYQQVATYLNENKGGDFKPSDIEGILHNDTVVIKQNIADITDIRPIIEANIAQIASLIRNSFNVNRANSIYLIGGGAADTLKYWEKVFPTAKLVENSRMINSKIFDIVASSI